MSLQFYGRQISDSTTVGGKPWSELKKEAFEPGTKWREWHSNLSEYEKNLLEMLKTAQEA